MVHTSETFTRKLPHFQTPTLKYFNEQSNRIGKALLWSATQQHPVDSGIQPALQSEHHKASGVDISAKQKEDSGELLRAGGTPRFPNNLQSKPTQPLSPDKTRWQKTGNDVLLPTRPEPTLSRNGAGAGNNAPSSSMG
ncbi:MAG: hypothetical protein ABL903_01980 [Methylococcales bacterium]